MKETNWEYITNRIAQILSFYKEQHDWYSKYRALGAIEELLHITDIPLIDQNGTFLKKDIPCREWSWKKFRMVDSSYKENYPTFILRVAREYLTDMGKA